jgi:hypothetical protein
MTKMKNFLIVIILLTSLFSYGQKKSKLTDDEQFKKYVSENLNSFTFNGQKPVGNGWIILENLFAENQFVGWGEYHNSPVVSKLTTYALESASQNGFKTWCVETSPFVASELMRISKTPSPYDAIINIPKVLKDYATIPFFETKEDAEMLSTANKFNYKIWGIDQEFQMAFPYCIGQVYNAQSISIKKKYKTVVDSLKAKWWMPEEDLLDSLKNAIPQKNLKTALEDIKTSEEIYNNAYTYKGNNIRATLMKNNFYNYFDNLKSPKEKIFLKMGANHLAKGINLESQQYDIGNSLFELTQRTKSKFSNVYLIPRYSEEEGKIVDEMDNPKKEYSKEFLNLYDKEKWIVLDLRPLRFKIKYDKTLSSETYQTIEKYDFVAISPEVRK